MWHLDHASKKQCTVLALREIRRFFARSHKMGSTNESRVTNRHLQILKAAEEGRYGVLAAIAYNIEHILGLVRAAEKARSPLILQFFPWASKFSDGLLISAAAEAARRATVPASVHLDHAQEEDIIKLAADTFVALRQHHGRHVAL